MKRYPKEIKEHAICLRKEGRRIKDIVLLLGASKSAVKIWVKNIQLTDEQRKNIDRNRLHLQLKKGRLGGELSKKRINMGEVAWKEYQRQRKINNAKKYNSLYFAKKREEVKRKIVELKGGKCLLCGYNKCLAALEFHHRNPDEKDFIIAKAFFFNINKLKDELDKCDLLCCRCHVELHDSLRKEKRSGGEVG